MISSPNPMQLRTMDTREFKMFRALIEQQTGISLREGKQVMLASRLSRRVQHHQLAGYAEYYSLLERDGTRGKEMVEFINCVTTNKTSFFRESHHFDFLKDTLVPGIRRAARNGADRKIRIWSAACSTGEEPYSIAISLLDALQGATGQGQDHEACQRAEQDAGRSGLSQSSSRSGGWKVEVFASDVDTKVLETAAHATYGESALETVDLQLQKRYFLRGRGEMLGQVRVKADVVACLSFQRINLMSHPWQVSGLFDAIFFRNALIYFNQETQNSFLRKMLRFLKPRGYLFLGHSEHVPWLHDAVAPLNKTIYQLRDVN